MPVGGAPVFTALDCAFLQEFAGGTQTSDLTEDQTSGIADLRTRLLEAATMVAEQLSADWRPFKSDVNQPSISGHVAKLLWSCAYPSASPNKSFGLQVSLIVQPSGIELCFCLGAGVSQSKSGDTRDELGREFARVHERMQTAPRGVVEGVTQRLGSEWSFRKKWLMPPGAGEFRTFEEWLRFAGASSEGGASISRYFAPEQVDGAAPAFVDDLVRLSRAVRPLVDWVYSDDGTEMQAAGPGVAAVEHDESGRIPRGFRRDLFDAAVAELKRERLELSRPTSDKQDDDFRAIPNDGVPQGYSSLIDQVVRLPRLREVQALLGFTRLNPPQRRDLNPANLVGLRRSPPTGFLPWRNVAKGSSSNSTRSESLAGSSVRRVTPRVVALLGAYRQAMLSLGRIPDPNFPAARTLLLHTLSHLLIRQVSLDCGYSSASIRERLYLGKPGARTAGVLLSTAASDSEGTLGGLVALGETKHLKRLLDEAMDEARRCSSDPLCSDHIPLPESGTLHLGRV